MSEVRDAAFTALDTFKDDLAERFICLCDGNDGRKLTLLKIYDTIDEIYDKHIEKWLDVGTVDSAPTHKWISVKERLPEDGSTRVLVNLDGGHFTKDFGPPKMDTDRCTKGIWVRWGHHVTHWMPLPEPPKENQ